MIGKIKEVQANGTWDRPEGTLYKFSYVMESGTELTAHHKTPSCPFKAGDEVEYEVKGSNSYGSWGKVAKPGGYTPQAGGGKMSDDTQKRIERSWAMGHAVQMMGPLIAVNVDAVKKYMHDACRLADVLLKARDTFPKFEDEEVVRSYWESQMAPKDEMPF